LNPESGIRDGYKVRIRIRDEQPGSYFLELRNHFFGVKILKFFDVDPGSGRKKVGSGINIPYPQHWSYSRYGWPDPDLYQNFMDPEHWL
jgi:hypothetical protein